MFQAVDLLIPDYSLAYRRRARYLILEVENGLRLRPDEGFVNLSRVIIAEWAFSAGLWLILSVLLPAIAMNSLL